MLQSTTPIMSLYISKDDNWRQLGEISKEKSVASITKTLNYPTPCLLNFPKLRNWNISDGNGKKTISQVENKFIRWGKQKEKFDSLTRIGCGDYATNKVNKRKKI